MFAFLDFNADRFTALIMNLLAVGGAYFVGSFLGWIGTWLFSRYVIKHSLRSGFYKTAQTLGGISAAVLAVLILFGHGDGWTMFGGGGNSDLNKPTSPSGDGNGGNNTTPTVSTIPPEVRPPELPPEELGGRYDRIRVTVLAGMDVQEGRFYQVEEDRTPKTIQELETVIRARKQAASKPIGVVPIYPKGSGNDTTGASLLFSLARREGFPIIPLDAPQ